MKGLDYVTNLLIVYKWQEKTYLQDIDAGPAFKGPAIRLYTRILEYEATLLIHIHQNAPKQWARDIFQAGDWSDRMASIQQCDVNCQKVTNAIDSLRAKEWREEERNWQNELLQLPRQDRDKRCVRALYSNYEAGKNVNPERISGTCEWFLNHTAFLAWRESQTSCPLRLSADPGCGKSVLSKFLVDRRGDVLTVNIEMPVVYYFFFKDGDVDRMDGAKAICAFLHQLIMQRPCLYQYMEEDFENKNEKFLTDFDALWNIFLKASEDNASHEIICVLDALDECQESSRSALIAKLVRLYTLRNASNRRKPILKFLVTSRPDFRIVRDFKNLTSNLSEIRLRGERESEQISREINLVIRHKVEELGSKLDLNDLDKLNLRENLFKIPHRTYLWLHLTFNNISERLELTKNDIAAIAKTIPEDVNQAYTAILDKSPDKERARRLLHIILAATRPLTLHETNIAMVIKEHHKIHEDIEIWRPDVSADRIKNTCGLFLTVVDSKVYLIHQTAREFLVCENTNSSSTLQPVISTAWKHSFCLTEANLRMAKICIWYLQLRDFQEKRLARAFRDHYIEAIRQYKEKYCFLHYAAQHWATHFSQAGSLPQPALLQTVAYKICDTLSQSFKVWFSIYWMEEESAVLPLHIPQALIGSYLGLDTVVELQLTGNDIQVDLKDAKGRTPLS